MSGRLFRFEKSPTAHDPKETFRNAAIRSGRARYACVMGKLAERLTDAARSGVYRVRAAGVPRAAAAEAKADLIEIKLAVLAGEEWRRGSIRSADAMSAFACCW
jgi:hypothetical protein